MTLAEAPPGPWCKAAAVMPAIAASRAPIIVVADADVWTPGLDRTIARVQNGATWAVPHTQVWRLSPEATAAVLEGTQTVAPGVATIERPYTGIQGGGAVVLTREVALDIPLDRRFVGWGQEDASWAVALHHLAGPAWRAVDPLFHFWHPPQERMSRRWGSPDGKALHRRYLAARDDPAALRALIEEAKTCSPTS